MSDIFVQCFSPVASFHLLHGNSSSHRQTKFCLISVFLNRSVDIHEFDILVFSPKFIRFYDTSH